MIPNINPYIDPIIPVESLYNSYKLPVVSIAFPLFPISPPKFAPPSFSPSGPQHGKAEDPEELMEKANEANGLA